MNDRSNIGAAAPAPLKPGASSIMAHEMTAQGKSSQVIESERSRIEAEARRLRAGGHYVSPCTECRVPASLAADLLGVAPKTLANWWATDRRGPRRLCSGPGRPAFYRLADVLAYRDQRDATGAD